jgi:hypothetical protein
MTALVLDMVSRRTYLRNECSAKPSGLIQTAYAPTLPLIAGDSRARPSQRNGFHRDQRVLRTWHGGDTRTLDKHFHTLHQTFPESQS